MNAPEVLPVLTPGQEEVRASGLLDRSGVLMMPTNNGKTWLAKCAIHDVVACGKKAVYLSPLRALAKELGRNWGPEFKGAGLGIYTGEHGVDELADNPGVNEAQVLIMTSEKFDFHLRQWEVNLGWLADVDLVVVDELHVVGSGRRGVTLEGVVTRMRRINPFTRFLGLSATLGNPDELGRWMGGECFVSRERSVPLKWSIRAYGSGEQKQMVVEDEVRATVAESGQVIVFVQSRPRAESIAQKLRDAGLFAMAHHAGLSLKGREEAEARFRNRDLQVLVATPTLAVGVNLPARKCVIFDLSRWEGGGFVDLPTTEIWQLAGRAGRRGLDPFGEVVLLAPKWNQKAARRHLKGNFEAIRSAMGGDGAWFVEQVLVVIGSRLALTAAQASRVMCGSLWGWSLEASKVDERVKSAVGRMESAGMVETSDAGFVRATRLGRIAVRFQLTPETVIAWSAAEAVMPNATLMDLLVLVCASVDFTARMRVDRSEAVDLNRMLRREPTRIGSLTLAQRRQVLCLAGKDLGCAVKTALAIRAWTRLGCVEEAGSQVGAMAHEVEEARKDCVRLLHAFLALLKERAAASSCPSAEGACPPMMDDEPGLRERLQALCAMVSAGLDDESATLALVDGIGPVMARRLVGHGTTNIEELALADPVQLAEMDGLSETRARRWIGEAGQLMRHGGAFRYREACCEDAHESDTRRFRRGLDANRWARAKSLIVEVVDGGWRVSGGSEPHFVSRVGHELGCDCMDARRGSLCKHQIAIWNVLGDDGVPCLSGDYPEWGGATLDLEAGWSAGGRAAR